MTGRRRLLSALMLGTALSAPVPAQAGPVGFFVQGFLAALTGGTLSGLAAVAPAAASGMVIGGFAKTFLGSLAGRVLLGLGAAALSSALAPKPELPKPSGSFTTFVQPISPMERVYGRVKKSGPMGFRSGMVGGRHWTVTLAAHSTKGPVAHYLDLYEVTLDGSGQVETEPLADEVNLRTYTGKAGQAADPTLVSEFPQVTAAHDFAGHSYAAIFADRVSQERALKVYTQGREPEYAPIWEGWDEIYDPRTGATGYSNNWALCFAHELSEVWGFTVDWDRVAIEADVCDETVTNRDGGTQRRYTFNHVFKDDQDFEQVRAQFMAAANAFMWQRPDGVVDFYAGRWIAPTLTLTASDFESLTYVDGNFGMNPPTEYVAEYREPANGYRETPSAAYVVDAAAPRIAQPLAIYGINSHNQALRVLKPLARSERAPAKLSGTLRLAGFELIAGREWSGDSSGAGQVAHRFVTVDHPILPEPVTCEVSGLSLREDGITFDVDLAQSVAADWAFEAATEEPAQPDFKNEDVSASDPIDPITDLTGAAVTGTGGVAQIRWEWTAPSADRAILRVRRAGEEYIEFEQPDGADSYVQTGLIDGATYQAQIRARSPGYRFSDWKPDTPLEVVAVANTDAPAAHPAGPFALSLSGTDVTVAFDAPDDAAYHATRIYRADYSAGHTGPFDFADAAYVRLEYGLRDAADQWVDAALSAGVYAYWIAPINASGVEGAVTGPETIEVL